MWSGPQLGKGRLAGRLQRLQWVLSGSPYTTASQVSHPTGQTGACASAAEVNASAAADVIVRAGADATRSFPGFTSTFDPSTLGMFKPEHHRGKQRNDPSPNNKKSEWLS